jgi:hypothetical protein
MVTHSQRYQNYMSNRSTKGHNVSEIRHMDSALGTALYILRSLNEGQSKYEIIQHMDNNEKLVTVWIQYLKAVGWLREDADKNPLATENGKLWIQRYEKAISIKFEH